METQSSNGGLIVGIDGGGSKTVAWLASLSPGRDEGPIGRGRSGASNPCSVGFSTSIRVIDEAIGFAFNDAGIRPCKLEALCISLAGSDEPELRGQFTELAERQAWAKQILLCNDAAPILACVPDEEGVALIAGTGSFALGRSAESTVAKAGGWGYRIGDEGSGYALAIEALSVAVRMAEGRGGHTQLLARWLQHFGVDEPRQLIKHVYSDQMDRTAIAELAPIVIATAEAGDEVALGIARRAAVELAGLVESVRQQLGLARRELQLAVAGGILIHHDLIQRLLAEALDSLGVQCDVTRVPDPVAGSVKLARKAVRRLAEPH